MLGIYNSGVKVKCQSKTLTHAPVNSTVQENIRAQKSPIKGLIGGISSKDKIQRFASIIKQENKRMLGQVEKAGSHVKEVKAVEELIHRRERYRSCVERKSHCLRNLAIRGLDSCWPSVRKREASAASQSLGGVLSEPPPVDPRKSAGMRKSGFQCNDRDGRMSVRFQQQFPGVLQALLGQKLHRGIIASVAEDHEKNASTALANLQQVGHSDRFVPKYPHVFFGAVKYPRYIPCPKNNAGNGDSRWNSVPASG